MFYPSAFRWCLCDGYDSDAFRKQAERNFHHVHAQHVSKIAIDTFMLLLKAYLANTPTTDIHVRDRDSKDEMRLRVSALRQASRAKFFRLPNGDVVEFQIPKGTPYRLELSEFVNQSLIWAHHLEHQEETLIHTYERLFFRKKTLYIRDTRVNKADEVSKIAELMKCSSSDLTPTMHYISSGEMRGAIALQQYFGVECSRKVGLSADVQVPAKKPNLILLGSPRLDAPHLLSPENEKYKAFEGGILPGFHDRTADQYRRIVHVLMSRRHSLENGTVHTVFESSHGRATQGVCERLVGGDKALCESIMVRLNSKMRLPPDLFQVIFKVELSSGGGIAHVNKVEVLDCYQLPRPRPRRRMPNIN